MKHFIFIIVTCLESKMKNIITSHRITKNDKTNSNIYGTLQGRSKKYY